MKSDSDENPGEKPNYSSHEDHVHEQGPKYQNQSLRRRRRRRRPAKTEVATSNRQREGELKRATHPVVKYKYLSASSDLSSSDPKDVPLLQRTIDDGEEKVKRKDKDKVALNIYKPKEPEKPYKPEKPKAPEKPNEPEKPKPPKKPKGPEKPKEPEKPYKPEKPKEPEKPKAPEKPKEPVKPMPPEKPKPPKKPKEPEKPKAPEKPKEPEKPYESPKPFPPEKPLRPQMGKWGREWYEGRGGQASSFHDYGGRPTYDSFHDYGGRPTVSLLQMLQGEREFRFGNANRALIFAAIFFGLETTSFILELIGNNNWRFLLPSCILSAIGCGLAIYPHVKKGSHRVATKKPVEKRVVETAEIGFSILQLIITSYHFIQAIREKNMINASPFTLVFAAIVLWYTIKSIMEVVGENTSSSIDSLNAMTMHYPFPQGIPPNVMVTNVPQQISHNMTFAPPTSFAPSTSFAPNVPQQISPKMTSIPSTSLAPNVHQQNPPNMTSIPSTSRDAAAVATGNRNASVSNWGTGSSLTSHIERADHGLHGTEISHNMTFAPSTSFAPNVPQQISPNMTSIPSTSLAPNVHQQNPPNMTSIPSTSKDAAAVATGNRNASVSNSGTGSSLTSYIELADHGLHGTEGLIDHQASLPGKPNAVGRVPSERAIEGSNDGEGMVRSETTNKSSTSEAAAAVENKIASVVATKEIEAAGEGLSERDKKIFNDSQECKTATNVIAGSGDSGVEAT